MSLKKIELPFDVELLPVQQLSFGNITCLYENGNLRYIKYGDQEVLRMIYTAVRDENWATAPYEIESEVVKRNEDSFLIHYTAFYHLNDICYKANVRIEGKESSLSFSMEGEALSGFLRNRIGLCVLHSIQESAGKKVRITHPDGTAEDSAFPQLISPHQPFKGIKKMQWDLSSAAKVLVEFEGDVFETEDQRNWTDFSFKTYSTPLDLPFPVKVDKGDTIYQKMTLTIVENTDSVIQQESKERAPLAVKLPFPKLGYERAPKSPRLTKTDIEFLQQIPFDHYRVTLHLSEPDWKEELQLAVFEAKELNAKLELIIFSVSFGNEYMQELINSLGECVSSIMSVLLIEEGKKVTSPALLEKTYESIKAALPDVKIGYGTDGFFAELNRNRPMQNLPYDFLSYSINPQVHASDTRTLMENLEAQGETIKTIQSFAPGKAIHVSPVTFRIREEQLAGAQSHPTTDSRMYTSVGAMWTMLAIKNLAGADCISFYQAKSYRGILNEAIASEKNTIYQALKQLKRFNPKWVILSDTDRNSLLVENNLGEQLEFTMHNSVE